MQHARAYQAAGRRTAFVIKNLPELRAELDRVDTKDAIVVVYLDVGDISPVQAMRYVETVKREMGKDIPEPVVWVPQRNGAGTKVVSIPERGVRAIYVDVGDIPPGMCKQYLEDVKRSAKHLPKDVPFIASRGGVAAIELLDESEMNERGWYYYGVKRDGTPIA